MEENYTYYDAIDFADDPTFIRWVKGSDPKATSFWEAFQKEHPEKRAEIREASVIVKAIQIKDEAPSQARIRQLWDKIDAATTEKSEMKPEIAFQVTEKSATVRTLGVRRWLPYVAAAASIAIIAFFFFNNPTTTINTTNGQHLVHELPDRSKVELNAASKILYKSSAFDKERIVELEGEAFFEVEKGTSFKVVTTLGEVEVLGTSFNVNTRNGGLEVNCRTGKVKVTANGNAQILTPNQSTRFNVEKASLELAYLTDTDKEIGWRKRDFYFSNVSFSVVIGELERQYDIKIECDPTLQNRVGEYIFKGSLEEALKSVSYQLNAKPVVEGKNIRIISQ